MLCTATACGLGCTSGNFIPSSVEQSAAEQGGTTAQESDTATASAESAAKLTGEFDTQFAALSSGESDKLQLRVDAINSQQLALLSDADGLLDLLLDAGGPVDADMEAIAGLKQIEHLRIRQTQLSDLGIELLCAGKLDQLAILNLPQARITSVGIGHLRHVPSLTNLRLGGTQIDDAAVKEIANLPQLRSLHLIGPGITGAALEHLATAPKLTSFYLDDCDLPADAWNALFAAKPNIHVHVDQHHHDRNTSSHKH